MTVRHYLAVFLAGISLAGATLDVSSLNSHGADLERQGRYSEAEAAFLNALQQCRADRDGGCSLLPSILTNLGSLYYATARYREAEPVLRQAVELRPQVDVEQRASALFNLAAVYRMQARYEEAGPLYERALELNPSNPKIVTGMALLAQDKGDKGDLALSEALIRQALSMFDRNGSAETVEGALTLTILGSVLESEGKVVDAQRELEHALAIQQRILGPDHVSVADTLGKLGQAYRLQNRLAQAEQMHRRALAILRAHPPALELGACLNNLGNLRAVQRRWKEAESLLREGIAVWEKLLGPEHPHVAAGLTNLAQVLQSRHRYEEAAVLMERALRIDVKSFPPAHSRIALDLNNASGLAFARKRYDQAERLLSQSVAALEKSLPGHPHTGLVMTNLAEVYRMEKKLAESAEMYRRGLEILVASWSANDPRLLAPLQHYAMVLRAREEYADAARLDVQAGRIRTALALRSRPQR